MERNTLYKAYLKDKEQKEKEEKIIKKYNLSKEENTIVINKKNNFLIKLFSLVADTIGKILKLAVILIIVILVTIGATVVLNKDLLNYIIEFIGRY